MSGLYIHIPFCRSRCSYCDFYSVASRSMDARGYVDALLAELDARKGDYPVPFDTIYIGGGTPTMLPPEELTRLIRATVAEAREGAEVTVEANPDDITDEIARSLIEAGANRVSMGVQSLVDSELKAISRRHDAAGAVRAVEHLREAGIDNISLDLMYGLPGQTIETFAQSVEGIIALNPEHISAYLLSYEPGTRLTKDLEAGKIEEYDDKEAEKYYRHLCRAMDEAGYEHYEISNFARPGYWSRHNSSYWDPALPYLGLGAGAHSYDGRSRRRANRASVSRYMANPCNAADPNLCEQLSPEEIFEEKIMLALRTRHGVNLATLEEGERDRLLRQAAHLLNSGRLILSSDTLTIPETYWLIADYIISDLFL
ncbi:MAG: radical SAM family heme chaperone HemW [Pseudoflavonifractor sp.]|nr:radical SAM family heme chaperone HemW [Alloprevotella sp.]MCM1116351.1 radical SAM family heme chaperone HemW [Pseudoflavonifractor sp.]